MPLASIRAAIFDLDGTLVDNMPLHQESFDRFATRNQLPEISDALRRSLDGKRNRDIFPVLLGRKISAQEQADFAAEKEGYYRELSAGRLAPVAGLLDFLELLRRRSLRIGIATSAPAENVEHTLEQLELQDRFEVIVRADEVQLGKPHPDVFLEAARRLAVPAETCLAFEDSLHGLQAAKAAGMKTVALTTTFASNEIEIHGHADWIVADYREHLRSWHAS